MRFEKIKDDTKTKARTGKITTDHGTVNTPIFMPVGTAGTVKGIFHRELENDIRAQIILGNTYHLYLRPGLETMMEAGGLHRFVSWNGPMLTDSGGFQIFSLAANRKITPEGCTFRSHIDGSKHFFSPENVIDTQRIIGADIIMPLDECTPGTSDRSYAAKSLELTQQWLERSLRRFDGTESLYGYGQTVFPIVQGCVYPELRKIAAEHAASLDRDGYAIGGLSVGEPAETMYAMIEIVNSILPDNRPRYLMGVGTPVNILEGISRGIDMFDCVMPTRNGRNGMLFTSEGIINIKNKQWERDFSPIDPGGASFVDHCYSRAYLRHLFIAGEMLGAQIASIHNLTFYMQLVGEARSRIGDGTFCEWKETVIPKLSRRCTNEQV
jgi:queuine tRNA-ribosyltransferase